MFLLQLERATVGAPGEGAFTTDLRISTQWILTLLLCRAGHIFNT